MNINDITRSDVEEWMKDRVKGLDLDSLSVSASVSGITWNGWIGTTHIHDSCYSKFLGKVKHAKENPNAARIAKLEKELEELKGGSK